MSLYTYRATCDRVVDGDTAILTFDLGFSLKAKVSVRLLGIDAPEVVGADKPRGVEAAMHLARLIAGVPLIVRTQRTDSFGRYLAHVTRESDGLDVGRAMIDAGHAKPFP